MTSRIALVLLGMLMLGDASAGAEAAPRCREHDPMRQPFFGDTHVHTAFSFDAMGQGTRATPADAYRYARGEPIGLPPFDATGRPLRRHQLRRPLDWAMVSDHSELLGETRICETPGMPGHDAYACRVMRRWPLLGYALINGHIFSQRNPQRLSFCGADGSMCREAARGPWEEIQRAAEEALDRSPECRFTSFIGYEWTGMPGGDNIHRNVVFRGARVPRLPANFIDAPSPGDLWDALDRDCLEAGHGCDVLAIPHNSNVSNGLMWPVDAAPTRKRLAQQARLEVLVEITQHKGDSECRPGAADELCAFETLPWPTMTSAAMPWLWGTVPDGVYVREALGLGLLQRARTGVNPYRFGLIGSTDTHYATPGMVDEDVHPGHGAGTVSNRLEVAPLPDQARFNPGGLAVLWAEENSRDALFDAMRRREAYATSGPRIALRFFAGASLPDDLCAAPDFARRGYAQGVPMGSVLTRSEAEAGPGFAVWALKDPGTPERPGTPLHRIQIVKGWVVDGARHERVYEVAGTADPDAGVDLATCTPRGPGAEQLCSVWRDPDFEPTRDAFYYARVVENPTCRWHRYHCNAAGVSCEAGAPPGFEACCDGSVPATIQERAWSSPIWYTADP